MTNSVPTTEQRSEAIRSLNLGVLAALEDELCDNILGWLNARDLLSIACASPLLALFANEDSLWRELCLRRHGNCFHYQHTWRRTVLSLHSLTPAATTRPLTAVQGFTSNFLYARWYRSNVDLSLYEPDMELVERRPLASIDSGEFSRRYDAPGLPVVLTDGIRDWGAMSSWTPQGLAEKCGQDVRFNVSHTVDACKHEVKMSMSDYVHYMAHQKDETPLYVFDAEFGEKVPNLLNDYSVASLRHFPEDLLACMGSKRPSYRWLVIGPGRSGAPWHLDPNRTSAWNALIAGRKRWALYPPGPPPPGVTACCGSEQFELQSMDPDDFESPTSLRWYLEVYPHLTAEQRPLEIVQRPGDVVFIPSGWWHMVLNLEPTVSCTQNFVSRNNLSVALDDLASQYGVARILELHSKIANAEPDLRRALSLLRLPFDEGCACESEYVESFSEPLRWALTLERILCHVPGLEYPCARDHAVVSRCPECMQRIEDTGAYAALLRLRSHFGEVVVLTSRANPIFAVGPDLVVKLFSSYPSGELNPRRAARHNPFFGQDGEQSFQSELCVLHAVAESHAGGTTPSPWPELLAKGRLSRPDCSVWSWPYIVMRRVPGIPLRKLWQRCGRVHGGTDASGICTEPAASTVPKMIMGPILQRAAAWLGNTLRELHNLKCGSTSAADHEVLFARKCWSAFLQHQRTEVVGKHWRRRSVPCNQSGALAAVPYPMLAKIDPYLPCIDGGVLSDELIGNSCLMARLHGDLNSSNVLGCCAPSQSYEIHSSGNVGDGIAAWLRRALKGVPPTIVDAAITAFEAEDITPRAVPYLSDSELAQLGLKLGPRALVRAAARQLTDAAFASDAPTAASLAEWRPTTLLDFGDSRLGDPLYDLVALHIGTFRCDKNALAAFLGSYSRGDALEEERVFGPRSTFVRRAMCLTLLHPGDPLTILYRSCPGIREIDSWEGMAALVWEIRAAEV